MRMLSLVGRRGVAVLATAVVAGAALAAAPAVADEVYNNIDASIDATAEAINLGVGGPNGSVTMAVNPTNNDGKNGCNLTGQTTLTVSVTSSSPTVATVSPSTLTFDSCGATGVVSVHPVAVGDTTVSLAVVSNDSQGAFDLAPATFTVHVTATVPPNTAPKLQLPGPITAEATGPGGAVVTYTATATDAEDSVAPVPTCTPASGSLFPLGTTTVTCTATDTGGLSTTGQFTVTVRDTTGPTVSVTTAATKDASTGWYNATSSGTSGIVISVVATDVVDGPLTPTCTDNGSPLALTAGSATLGDGVHSVQCTAVDSHSNTGSASATFKVDQTLPTISAAYAPPANAAGWDNADVVVTYTCTDGVSGLAAGACPASDSVTTEGTTTLTHTVTDQAGNTASGSWTVKLDKTAPTIEGNTDRAANGAGWYNAPVTVSFSCADSGSGIASCSGPTTLSTDGANQSVTGNAADVAGNTSSATVSGINIDQTPPTISLSSRTPANGAGWNNTDVTVAFSCSDGGSGVATYPQPVTLTSEGAGQSVTGTCTDAAGNTSTLTVSDIKIDKTKPVITGLATPGANSFGWNNGDVTVSFACADNGGGSGIATDTVAGGVLATEGTNLSITNTGQCVDVAGNVADPNTVGGINIDKTAPVITGSASPAPNTYGWNTTDVTVSFTCADTGTVQSGIDPASSVTGATLHADGANQSVTSGGTCADEAGNVAAPGVVNGINLDRTPPTLTPSVSPNPVVLHGSATASPGPFDATSGVATSSCDPVNTNTVGSGQTVACTAMDNAGNTNSANATYAVVYATGGSCLGSPGHTILQPVNPDGTSVFKLGSTVPAKFRVCDANGVSISTPGLVTSFKLIAKSTAPSDTLNEDVVSTTPDTQFRWDSTAQQWIYNISTKGNGLTSGTLVTYQIQLNDGSNITFKFALK